MARLFRTKSRCNARKTLNTRKVHRPLWMEPAEDRRLLAVTIPGNFDFFVTEPSSTNIDIGTDPGGDLIFLQTDGHAIRLIAMLRTDCR